MFQRILNVNSLVVYLNHGRVLMLSEGASYNWPFMKEISLENPLVPLPKEAGQPFLAYMATNAPHGPMHAPEEFSQPYQTQQTHVSSFYGMIANIDQDVCLWRQFRDELCVACEGGLERAAHAVPCDQAIQQVLITGADRLAQGPGRPERDLDVPHG